MIRLLGVAFRRTCAGQAPPPPGGRVALKHVLATPSLVDHGGPLGGGLVSHQSNMLSGMPPC